MPRPILNKGKIKKKYQALVDGKNYTPQQRGLEFEKIIFSLLQNEMLEPKSAYEPKGEQVDGSFFWQGQTFLLEAKWVKDPLPASSIYSFKGKLDGKFHTSSGVFLSVNGYSEDVEDALKFGKSLNILLFDENDIPMLFNGDVTFLDMLKFKLRAAGDTGSLKAPYKLKGKAKEISKTSPELLKRKVFLQKVKTDATSKRIIFINDLLVFVEGRADVKAVKNLIEPIKERYSLSYRIEILGGVADLRQLPSLLSAYDDYRKTKAVIVILDSDQATQEMNGVITNLGEQLQKSSIPVRPIFLYLTDGLKDKLASKKFTIEELRSELIFEKLEEFIQQIAQDYYDPEISTPQEILKSRLDALEWDFENGVIETQDDYGTPFSIDSLEKLIDYLNEEIIQVMHGEMPWEWLKEQDALDYEDQVRQYLLDDHTKEITKMGWDINDL